MFSALLVWGAQMALAPEAYTLQPSHFFLICGALSLVAIGTGLLLSSRLVQDLLRIEERTIEIPRELTIPDTAPSDPNEIRSLARAFADMTIDFRVLQQELHHKERLAALGQFGAGVAHQIKNPLTVILASVQLLEEELRTKTDEFSPSLVEYLRVVKEETKRANGIVMDLMKFARKIPKPQTQIDLSLQVQQAIELVKPLLHQNKVVCTSEIPTKPQYALADSQQIHEVLINVVQNAVDAMESRAEKQIWISMSEEKGSVALTIRDNGMGMDEETRRHLFEPFFTRKPMGKGTGLGLASALGIVTNHGGRIEVESTLGEGTRIKILLPAITRSDRLLEESMQDAA